MTATLKGPAVFDKNKQSTIHKNALFAAQTGMLANLKKLLHETYSTLNLSNTVAISEEINLHNRQLLPTTTVELIMQEKRQELPYLTERDMTDLLLRAARHRKADIVNLLLLGNDDLQLNHCYENLEFTNFYKSAHRFPVKVDINLLKKYFKTLAITKDSKSKRPTLTQKMKDRDSITLIFLQSCFNHSLKRIDYSSIKSLMKMQYKKYFIDKSNALHFLKHIQSKLLASNNIQFFTSMNGLLKDSKFALLFFKKQIDNLIATEHKNTWHYLHQVLRKADQHLGKKNQSDLLLLIAYAKEHIIKFANYTTFIESTKVLDYSNHLYAHKVLESLKSDKEYVVDQKAKAAFFNGCLKSAREADIINNECQHLNEEMIKFMDTIQLSYKLNNSIKNSYEQCTRLLKILLDTYTKSIDHHDQFTSRNILEFLRNKQNRFEKIFLSIQLNQSTPLTSIHLKTKNSILIESMLKKHERSLSSPVELLLHK